MFPLRSGPIPHSTYKSVGESLVKILLWIGHLLSYLLPSERGSLPQYLAIYAVAAVLIYVGIKGRRPATVICPFQVPPPDKFPFGDRTVANLLCDSFTIIHEEAEEGVRARSGQMLDFGTTELVGLKLPEILPSEFPLALPPQSREGPTARSGQAAGLAPAELAKPLLPDILHIEPTAPVTIEPTAPVTAEVKGMSLEALISLARRVLGTQRLISGDVLLQGGNFLIVARSQQIGPWQAGPKPVSPQGLQEACRVLALQIVRRLDPTLAAAHEIATGDFEAAYERLKKLISRD
jgi:hypothetical protein